MSTIQSSIGLITGVPIQETVDKLMSIAARPRNLLAGRNSTFQSEQLAVNTLSTLLLSIQYEINKLDSSRLFHARTVTSSNTDALTAALIDDGSPAVGSYTFTPVQTANAHQFISDRFGPAATATGVGAFTFGVGGFIDEGIGLDNLNAGEGVARGQIRITDRSGASQIIDLRFARNVDDVLDAINASTTVNVIATTDGDVIRLTDNTGQTIGNLIVQEVGTGTTAAGLGLASINVAATTATGSDLLSLHDGMLLRTLNDGNGVQLRSGDDLTITFRDASSLDVDLGAATALGTVVDALNAADPAKLTAAISASGDTIELTDLTAGGGAFAVSSTTGGTAAEDLGLTGTAAGGVMTSRRLLAGLKSSLVTSLNGGAGFTALGAIDLTDRSGATDTVDLSSAETLDDIVTAIHAASVGITATINGARNGIELTDTTGATASHLIVANGDATNSADALGIAINDATTRVDGGSLNRQTVSEATLLSALNEGDGVDSASFFITDSAGEEGAVPLNTEGEEITTIGGVIEAINGLSIGVTAQINDTGDGIVLTDTAGGSGMLTTRDVGNHTTAADLGLLGTADASSTQTIDGTKQKTIEIAESISLTALNAGQGVEIGTFKITDTGGTVSTIDLDPTGGTAAVTVGDVVDAINAASVRVTAQINEAGDGIVLIDTAGGAGTLIVAESGGTTAADLNLLGSGSAMIVDDASVHGIDGAGTFDSSSVGATALDRVATEINALKAGATASTLFDGEGHRLSIIAETTGLRGELLIDAKGAGFEFAEVSPARDALLLFGSAENGATGLLASSSSNTFSEIITGIDLTVVSGSLEEVAVDVTASDGDLTTAIQDFISAYNSLRGNLDKVTNFDAQALTTGILFGSNEALRVDVDLANLVTGRFYGVGSFQSLEEIGIEVDDKGKLSLNETKLSAAFEKDAASIETLFTDETLGIAAKFDTLIEQLAGKDNSLLSTKYDTLGNKIEDNTDRIAFMDGLLDKQRTRLLAEYYQMESIVAQFQVDLAALQSFQAVPPLTVQ